MDMSYNPGRGFFVGKIAICAAILAAIVLIYPAWIKADALPVSMTPIPYDSSTIANLDAASSALVSLDSLKVWITAYASVPQETSDHPFITASGEHVRDGIVAANFLPFGTHIQIPALFGNKVFTVEDRMNRIFSNRIDIWMPTVTNAVDFGIRHVQVVIVGDELADAR